MTEQKQISTWEDYIRDHPSEFETLKNSRIYHALLNSISIEHQTIKETVATAKVETQEDVCRFNHDQGALQAVVAIYSKLTKPIPDDDDLSEDPDPDDGDPEWG